MVARCVAMVLVLAMVSPAMAAFLSVDFQHTSISAAGVTQSGFSAFNQTDGANVLGKTFATSEGNINLKVSGQDTVIGGFFTRTSPALTNSGAFTYADLYTDFVFKNDTTNEIDFTLSGLGINTSYLVTYYSYDNSTAPGDGPTSHSVTFTGISGSSGSSSLSYTSGVAPTTNSQYAVTAQFTADGTGTLTIKGVDVAFPRINGLELSLVTTPEPSSVSILVTGMAMLLVRRRRQG